MGNSMNHLGREDRRYQPVVRPTATRYYADRIQPMAVDTTGDRVNARRPRQKTTRNPKLPILIGFLFLAVIACFGLCLLVVKGTWFSDGGVKAGAEPTQVDPMASLLTSPSPGGKMKVLLLGSDQRPDDPGYRTDVMILLLVDADKLTVSAVSFPRDLWVNAPDLYEMKINQVEGLGGFTATANMFEANFGVRPDYYVMTNFVGFTSFIDRIGGIDVQAAETLIDDCDLPQAKDGDCTIDPGLYHMDGATALWYVRSRSTTSDLDRLRRAQEVVYGVFKQMMTVNAYLQIPQLQAEFADNLETNLDAQTILSMLPVAARIFQDSSRITHYAITEEQSTPSWSWDGMWILLPDPVAIQGVLTQAGFFNP